MKWVLTVIEGDRLLFRDSTTDPDELEACAREARRLRPRATIFLRAPTGGVVEWPAD
jgi:hypothetical protein